MSEAAVLLYQGCSDIYGWDLQTELIFFFPQYTALVMKSSLLDGIAKEQQSSLPLRSWSLMSSLTLWPFSPLTPASTKNKKKETQNGGQCDCSIAVQQRAAEDPPVTQQEAPSVLAGRWMGQSFCSWVKLLTPPQNNNAKSKPLTSLVKQCSVNMVLDRCFFECG